MAFALPFVDESNLMALLEWRDAIDAIESTLRAGLLPSMLPDRSVLPTAHGQLLLMPAEVTGIVGVKVATVAPENPGRGLPRIQAVFVLFDAVSLSPLAIFDGAALTILRTAAVSAVAVDHLARTDAHRLTVFGAGPQAWGHIQAIKAVRPVDSVVIVSRRVESATALARRVHSADVAVRIGDPEAVRDSDIVVCATTAREPIFDGASLSPRACVVAVGSHEADARELDARAFAGASRIVVEDLRSALREAGDIIQAIDEGAISIGDLISLEEALTLQPDGACAVFKSVGAGWQDTVVASAAYSRWSSSGELLPSELVE